MKVNSVGILDGLSVILAKSCEKEGSGIINRCDNSNR